MKKKVTNFLSNPWVIGIGTGTIVMVITMVVDMIDKKAVFSTLITCLAWCKNLILSILNFEIKLWWLLCGLVVLGVCLFFYSKYLDAKVIAPAEPKFLSYTKDKIKGYKMRWTWVKRYDGTYDIENLQILCSKCETPLLDTSTFGRKECVRCHHEHYKAIPNQYELDLLIKDNARRLCESDVSQGS